PERHTLEDSVTGRKKKPRRSYAPFVSGRSIRRGEQTREGGQLRHRALDAQLAEDLGRDHVELAVDDVEQRGRIDLDSRRGLRRSERSQRVVGVAGIEQQGV